MILTLVQTAGAGPSKTAAPAAEPQETIDMGWEDEVVNTSAKPSKKAAEPEVDESMLEVEREEAQVSRISRAVRHS